MEAWIMYNGEYISEEEYEDTPEYKELFGGE